MKLPRDYIETVSNGASTAAGDETLVGDQRAGEALMLGLRLVSGVDTRAFADRFGSDAITSKDAELRSLESAGLVQRTESMLRLTPAATLLANDVLCRLL